MDDASTGDAGDAGDADDGVLSPVFVRKLDANASAGPNDLFGATVAIDGQVAVVSAMNDAGASDSGSGSVFVFERTAGAWTYLQTLSVGQGTQYKFGRSVAVAGDIIVVGAPGDASLGTAAGAAYVFRRGASVWAQQAKLTATGGVAYEQFGTSVAVDGSVIVVGAPTADVGGVVQTGRVSVFQPTGAGGMWTQTDSITAGTDNSMNLEFGYSVAIGTGGVVAVGSKKDLVHVHERVGASWTRTGRITASTVNSNTALDFGTVVDIDGQHLIIGAPATTTTGEAYVLERTGNWATNFRKLIAADNTSDAAFGSSVAIHGGHALVGSYLAGTNDAGAAYFFQRLTNSYADPIKLTAADGSANDGLGFAAAMSATELLVGAALDDQHGNQGGSAYIWRLD